MEIFFDGIFDEEFKFFIKGKIFVKRFEKLLIAICEETYSTRKKIIVIIVNKRELFLRQENFSLYSKINVKIFLVMLTRKILLPFPHVWRKLSFFPFLIETRAKYPSSCVIQLNKPTYRIFWVELNERIYAFAGAAYQDFLRCQLH